MRFGKPGLIRSGSENENVRFLSGAWVVQTGSCLDETGSLV